MASNCRWLTGNCSLYNKLCFKLQVFNEETRHRLCVWHIEQNAISHCALLRSDAKFKERFDRCLKLWYNEEQFEREWSSMIDGYNLQNDAWFRKLYGLRHKWCRCLNKDAFSAGMLSSQRSESTNHSISFNSNKQTSLTQFFKLFDAALDRWRETEVENEFKNSKGYSKPKSNHALLWQATKVKKINIIL